MSETKSDKSEEPSKKLSDDFNFQQMNEKPSIIHVVLLNRTVRILFALGIFCTLLPIVDYFYFYSTEIAEYHIDDSGICSHYPIYQIPCGGENTNESDCIENACCFSAKTGCFHFLPSKYQFRVEHNQPWRSSEFLLPTKETSPLKTKSFRRMKLNVQEISDDSLSILLWNPDDAFAPDLKDSTEERSSLSNYDYRIYSPEMFIEIKRKSNNKTLLSSARGPLIAGENYFEWSVYLGSVELMGFDELVLKEGQRILINNEQSSVVPYVLAYDRESKHYHAVYFETIDSPAEIQILKSNVIVVRQFHSSSFELKLMTGPGYSDVRRQIMKQLPHYLPKDFWSYGVHFCRSSAVYNETETRADLNLLLSSESMPFDSHCIHDELTTLVISAVNTMSALEVYEEIIEKLREKKKKLLLHFSLSMIEESTNDFYQRAFNDELFLKRNGANFAGIYGKVKKVFYLDYITKSQEIADLLAARWIEISGFLNSTNGLFLQKSFLPDDTTNKSIEYLKEFRFKPKNMESYVRHLTPLDLKLNDGRRLLIHQLNNFGRKQIEVFQTLNEKHKFCITDSYREDSSCAMLIRELNPSWITFQAIVEKSVLYSLIGLSFFGTEVCGSNHGNVQEDLCIRWYQFAIFSPLFVVKSDKVPLKFTKYAERIMVHAVGTRYSFLNYMRMHLTNRLPILRSLRFEYPDLQTEVEKITKHQFMYGESLMIAPVTEPLVVELTLVFPEKYFEFWSGLEMPLNTTHFSVVMHDIPIFVRAGHIVALNLAYESLSSEEARLQPYFLIVALACTERFTCHSEGRLVVEKDFVEFKFSASENHLNITVITANPGRENVCDPERSFSTEFLLAKIYGLGDFKQKYQNSYLSLDLNVCNDDDNDDDWKESFSFLI